MSAGVTAAPRRTSIAAGSVARSLAEAFVALFSLLTGVMVARHLGPAGKGNVSSIGYVVALVGPAVTLGLGEAAVTLTRGRGVDLGRALSATIACIAATSVAGAAILVTWIVIQFNGQLDELQGAITAAVAAVPAMALWYALSLLVEAQGGLIASSTIKILIAVVTAVVTGVLVLQFELAVAGAVAGLAAGFLAGAVLTAAWLWRRRGLLPVLHWDRGYLRRALAIGAPVQASYLFVGLAARADLLMVQIVKGATAAGFYSVALTMGQLVAYGPVALSAASFPVSAGLKPGELVPFIERAGRTALAAGLVSAIVFAPILPFILPRLFGPGFSHAVAPALVLIPAGVLQGLQWIVCRLWAAQGRGVLLTASSAVTLAVMLALAAILVPAHGAMGAAIASLAAGAAGVAVSVGGHHRFAEGSATRAGFVPRPGDFVRIVSLPWTLWRRPRGGGPAA
jgi:O-antigen/teichoic acid export membrane protein